MAELESRGGGDDQTLAEQTEHLAKLHKMSTTAGIATQEYVAINNVAIASAVLGFATALALQHWVFLSFGLAGIVCGVIALVQVRDSNGTQGGKGIAWLGMGLSLALSGAAAAMMVMDSRAQAAERARVAQGLGLVGQQLKAGDYRAAYELLDPSMKPRVTFDRWQQLWTNIREGYGALTHFEGNGVVRFTDTREGTTAETMVLAGWETRPGDNARWAVFLRRDDAGVWRIYSFEPFEQRR